MYWRHRQLLAKRKQRLIQKAQKAHAVERLPQIVSECETWGKRFRMVQAIRAGVR
jgi:hypothetical protein